MWLLIVLSLASAGDVESLSKQIENLSGKEQRQLAALILRKSKEHGVDPYLVTAIAAKESMLGRYKVNKRSKDYGILQVNLYNINAYGLDKERLVADDEYGLEHGIRILKTFKKQYKSKEPKTWVCRYNIGNQNLDNPRVFKKCLEYLKSVNSNLYAN